MLDKKKHHPMDLRRKDLETNMQNFVCKNITNGNCIKYRGRFVWYSNFSASFLMFSWWTGLAEAYAKTCTQKFRQRSKTQKNKTEVCGLLQLQLRTRTRTIQK